MPKKKKDTTNNTIETLIKVQHIHINEALVEFSREIMDQEIIKIINVPNDDNDILYLQDDKTLTYNILNKNILQSKITKYLAENNHFVHAKHTQEIATILQQLAHTNEVDPSEIENNILVNNGLIKINDMMLEFVPLGKDELKKAKAFKRINIDYKPDLYKQQNKVVEKFFLDIMQGDLKLVNYLWAALSTPFIERTKYEKAFIFYGETGANGKTVLAELMKRVYSRRNISHVELADMKEYNLALMEKGIINWVQDLEKYDSWPNFKKIVTGESVVVNIKYSDPVEKQLSTQLFINSNVLPRLGASRDGGYTRRLEFIPFNKTFKGKEKDPNILKKLSTTKNIEWIFSKLIHFVTILNDDYSGSWFKENRPASVKKLIKEQALADSSPLAFAHWLERNIQVENSFVKAYTSEIDAFVENGYIIGEINHGFGKIIYRPKMYKLYKDYCNFENVPPMSKDNFEKQLKETIFKLNKEERVSSSRGFYEVVTREDKQEKENENE